MTLDNLEKKVRDSYFKHDQWLNLVSHYEFDEKQTEQMVCLIDEEKNECIFCVDLRTFMDMEDGWASAPYMLYDAAYTTFRITIPKFKYLTGEDIKKAIKFIIRENIWGIFNVKIDGIHI
jgi:hypothetical protein